MIKNVIFDIGNVLTHITWEEFLTGKNIPRQYWDRVAKASFKAPEWNEVDRAVIPYPEVVELFVKNDPEMEQFIRAAVTDLKGFLEKVDYAIPWIEELKSRGFKTYCLSNYSVRCWEDCIDAVDFFPHLDGGVRSFEVNLIKPFPEIYRALMDKYSLIPEECVFLDDTLPNVEGARAVGIHGIHFKNYEQAKAELEELIKQQLTA